jgi:hypothetical protein
VSVSLTRVIAPTDPASITGRKPWNEYRIAIQNHSSHVLTPISATLIDSNGVMTGAASGPQAFAMTAAELQQMVERQTSAYGASMIGSAAVGAFLPGAGLLGGLLAPNYVKQEAEAQEQRIREFNRRALTSNTRLDSGGRLEGSLFFPQVSDPSQLLLGFAYGDGGKESIRVPLSR